MDNKTQLRTLGSAGLEERKLHNNPEYVERLKSELETIEELGFVPYFLVMWDIAKFVRDKGILAGPGRGCLTGDTQVLMADGQAKRLDQVEPKDLVVTKYGGFGRVLETHKYAVKETLVNVKTYFGDHIGITATKDHLVFGEKAVISSQWKRSPKLRNKLRKFEEPIGNVIEVPAGELLEGDWILFSIPKRKEEDHGPIDLVPYTYINKYPCNITKDKISETVPINTPFIGSNRDIYRKTGVSRGAIKKFRNALKGDDNSKNPRVINAYSKIRSYVLDNFSSLEDWKTEANKSRERVWTVRKEIKFDVELMWVIGKWVADGWVHTKDKRRWGICFHSEQIEQQEKVKKWLSKNFLEYKIYPHADKKLIQIEVCNGVFRLWWNNLFAGYRGTSQTKSFPSFATKLSQKKLLSLVKGYLDGDGHVEAGRVKATTVSKKLAYQLKYILLTLGGPSSIRKEIRKEEREAFKNTKPAYYITAPITGDLTLLWPKNKSQKSYRWRKINNQILCQVKSVTDVQSSEVFDLTILEDPSYSTASGVVHNSAAGSLLCYCLRITSVDPIKYGLYFERFLNRDRVSPPDIDYDCADRDRVIEYVKERYGTDRVARVGSLNFLRTKSAIRDIGRVLEKDVKYVDKLTELVPPPVAGLWKSFEAECEVEPKLRSPEYEDIITPLEKLWGVVRSYGTHAGGVAIAPGPINQFVPLYKDKDGNPVSQFDWRDLEAVGLLKFDILGLKTLEVIQLCINYIEEKGTTIDLEALDDGDEKAYKAICRGDLDGIFQLGGSESIKQLTVSIVPKKVEDLSFISALFRPGPLTKNKKTGKSMVDTAVARKLGIEEIEYQHPLLEPILKDTLGVIVYQEQHIRIAKDLAGFSGSRADVLRKAIGKKLEALMNSLKKEFIDGCGEKEISQEVSESIWNAIEGSAKYSFNLAHSLSYAVITYWTAYLKAHYPVEFYSALLACETKPEMITQYAGSAKDNGIEILPPDVNSSYVLHHPENGSIRFGLGHIKGMPQATAEEIVRIRNE